MSTPLADDDQAVGRARHGATHQHDVLLRVHAHHVVPEGARGHGGGFCSSGSELAVNFRKTLDYQARKLIGIHFDAPVGRGSNLIRRLGAERIKFARLRVKQQGSHRRGADVDAQYEGLNQGFRMEKRFARALAKNPHPL